MTEPRGTGPAGIRTVSELTGLSLDTLRWYEREGLLPLVERGPGGRRRYSPAAIRFVRLVQVLRRTGIPVEEARVQVRDPAAARRPRAAGAEGVRGAKLSFSLALVSAGFPAGTDRLP